MRVCVRASLSQKNPRSLPFCALYYLDTLPLLVALFYLL
jgi:hypothetical protein